MTDSDDNKLTDGCKKFLQGRTFSLENKQMKIKNSILIVDDEPEMQGFLQTLLGSHFAITMAGDGQEAVDLIQQQEFLFIILDYDLPKLTGLQVCEFLQSLEQANRPAVGMFSGNSGDHIICKAYDLGVDDYIVKPFDNEELIARVRAHLRRAPYPELSEELKFDNGNFRINFLNREVWVDGELVHLTPKEFSLLAVLIQNVGNVVARAELVKQAWGGEERESVDSLKLYVHYLRQKLEKDPQNPKYIVTSRGVGYRFMKHS